ncbi:cytochrome P450 [Aspergillus stella-maris]|uniref:cytochrome P450 n=1 Tax=Aspergillus stella-maris TaxID=1810926 RepID=UPI003CCD76D7
MTLTFSLEALQQTLTVNIQSLVLSAATLGIISHISLFRTLPVEEYLHSLLVIFRVGCIASAFNAGLTSSIAIYRLIFHRLRHFNGPWLCKLSRFYDVYLAGKNVQYHVEIAKMHEKYGDFIRTGPREVCIVRKSAVPLLLSPQSKCGKSTFYAQAQTESKYCNVHHTRDFGDHRRRRKAWDRGFSIKALASYEPRIREKADLLISHIEQQQGQLIDATTWSMFLSFDIMGKVGFGKEFNNLSTGVEHPGIKAVHDHMTILGTMGHIPWLLNLISHLPGSMSAMAEFFKWCEDEIVQKHKNWDINKHPQDVVSWLLKAYVEKDVSAAPSAIALHDDSRAVLVAGSETTATTLASTFYYLCKNSDVLRNLQGLLDEAMPGGPSDWAYDKIKNIGYLEDIINETLRLRPAILTGGYRVTPAEGLQVDEVYIPGDVNVFVPTQLLQTDERYYVDAKQFIPERWNERKELIREPDAPYFPFLYGPYVCPGKNLALMSLRISISKLAQLYDISFAPGETGELFETKTLDTFTTTLPPLNIQFVRR